MIFPFLLYKFPSNLRLELSFSYLIIFYFYLRIPIKFSLFYLANSLFLTCNSRLWLLFYVSLFSVNVKFANLEFAVFLKADSISGACKNILIILNFFYLYIRNPERLKYGRCTSVRYDYKMVSVV